MNSIQSSENLNILWANLIVEELVRHGIDYFCISPGSRSTPLTIAAVRHPNTTTKIFYDERGAAFYAMGYARASKKAAVLICSSGTAAANYYPAVIEASQENLPLIVLSADRPPELRNSGANQTIDQVELFGKYPRFFFDFPCPNKQDSASFVLSKVSETVAHIMGSNPGPVHLNCMFREPLAPKKEVWPTGYLDEVKDWLASETVFQKIKTYPRQGREQDTQKIISIIEENSFGIILAGLNENEADQRAILELAEKINWPIFADITSGLRFSSSKNVIHYFDQFLLSESIQERLKETPILHFGGQFVSKRLLQFLEKYKGQHIHILETEKIIDPAKSVSMRIQQPVQSLIKNILPKIPSKNKNVFCNELIRKNEIIGSHLNNFDSVQNSLNEVMVSRVISQDINENAALFLASSMPIRDMDMFGSKGKEKVIIGSNRGASGIDGTIASALGFAQGAMRPLTLLIGDLAFIHDMNSLALLNNFEYPVMIVLINNQGGGIFSFLPVAGYEEVFEDNFGTPHSFTFQQAAQLFGLDYFNPGSVSELKRDYVMAQKNKSATLMEIRTKRDENFNLHKKLQAEILKILNRAAIL
jgi:2-succinyl-5-enolpyruvyl-6-hydroxy-3-cyclohexene-1-carboxylate synthase